MDRNIRISIDRCNHVVAMIFPCQRWGSDVAKYIGHRYILQNTTSEVMWLCNVTTIEHEGETFKSSVFRKERLMHPRFITLLREAYFVWQRLGGDHADGRYKLSYAIGW